MMDIKGVTPEEAIAAESFLTQISFSAPGTIDAQIETLTLLGSFRNKLRQAIKEGREDDPPKVLAPAS